MLASCTAVNDRDGAYGERIQYGKSRRRIASPESAYILLNTGGEQILDMEKRSFFLFDDIDCESAFLDIVF